MDRTDRTRATFLIAALAVTLAAAAAGIGAYVAVRQNARAPDTSVGQPAPADRMAAALDRIDAESAAGEPPPGTGVAVESTEQVVEPAVAPAAAPPPAEAPRARSAPASPRPAARPAASAPVPAPPPPPRPAPEEVDRPAPRSVPTVAQPGTAPEEADLPAPRPVPAAARPDTAPASVRRPEAGARRDLPEVEGWRPADPASPVADRNAPARGGAAVRNLPPASARSEPSTSGAGADPRPPAVEELRIPADSVIGLQIDTFVTTDRAEVEDDVQARVTRDVTVARRVAIPAGSLVNGSVVMVERGGKLKGAARLGVRFHTVVLDDGVEVPIATETVYREGRSRGRDNAARIGGGAVAGAILGAIFGGGRGAAIGGAAGAAGGTAAAAAGDAEPATLPAGTTLTVRLSRPSSVTVER